MPKVDSVDARVPLYTECSTRKGLAKEFKNGVEYLDRRDGVVKTVGSNEWRDVTNLFPDLYTAIITEDVSTLLRHIGDKQAELQRKAIDAYFEKGGEASALKDHVKGAVRTTAYPPLKNMTAIVNAVLTWTFDDKTYFDRLVGRMKDSERARRAEAARARVRVSVVERSVFARRKRGPAASVSMDTRPDGEPVRPDDHDRRDGRARETAAVWPNGPKDTRGVGILARVAAFDGREYAERASPSVKEVQDERDELLETYTVYGLMAAHALTLAGAVSVASLDPRTYDDRSAFRCVVSLLATLFRRDVGRRPSSLGGGKWDYCEELHRGKTLGAGAYLEECYGWLTRALNTAKPANVDPVTVEDLLVCVFADVRDCNSASMLATTDAATKGAIVTVYTRKEDVQRHCNEFIDVQSMKIGSVAGTAKSIVVDDWGLVTPSPDHTPSNDSPSLLDVEQLCCTLAFAHVVATQLGFTEDDRVNSLDPGIEDTKAVQGREKKREEKRRDNMAMLGIHMIPCGAFAPFGRCDGVFEALLVSFRFHTKNQTSRQVSLTLQKKCLENPFVGDTAFRDGAALLATSVVGFHTKSHGERMAHWVRLCLAAAVLLVAKFKALTYPGRRGEALDVATKERRRGALRHVLTNELFGRKTVTSVRNVLSCSAKLERMRAAVVELHRQVFSQLDSTHRALVDADEDAVQRTLKDVKKGPLLAAAALADTHAALAALRDDSAVETVLNDHELGPSLKTLNNDAEKKDKLKNKKQLKDAALAAALADLQDCGAVARGAFSQLSKESAVEAASEDLESVRHVSMCGHVRHVVAVGWAVGKELFSSDKDAKETRLRRIPSDLDVPTYEECDTLLRSEWDERWTNHCKDPSSVCEAMESQMSILADHVVETRFNEELFGPRALAQELEWTSHWDQKVVRLDERRIAEAWSGVWEGDEGGCADVSKLAASPLTAECARLLLHDMHAKPGPFRRFDTLRTLGERMVEEAERLWNAARSVALEGRTPPEGDCHAIGVLWAQGAMLRSNSQIHYQRCFSEDGKKTYERLASSPVCLFYATLIEVDARMNVTRTGMGASTVYDAYDDTLFHLYASALCALYRDGGQEAKSAATLKAWAGRERNGAPLHLNEEETVALANVMATMPVALHDPLAGWRLGLRHVRGQQGEGGDDRLCMSPVCLHFAQSVTARYVDGVALLSVHGDTETVLPPPLPLVSDGESTLKLCAVRALYERQIDKRRWEESVLRTSAAGWGGVPNASEVRVVNVLDPESLRTDAKSAMGVLQRHAIFWDEGEEITYDDDDNAVSSTPRASPDREPPTEQDVKVYLEQHDASGLYKDSMTMNEAKAAVKAKKVNDFLSTCTDRDGERLFEHSGESAEQAFVPPKSRWTEWKSQSTNG
jgi:hypothetical protein